MTQTLYDRPPKDMIPTFHHLVFATRNGEKIDITNKEMMEFMLLTIGPEIQQAAYNSKLSKAKDMWKAVQNKDNFNYPISWKRTSEGVDKDTKQRIKHYEKTWIELNSADQPYYSIRYRVRNKSLCGGKVDEINYWILYRDQHEMDLDILLRLYRKGLIAKIPTPFFGAMISDEIREEGIIPFIPEHLRPLLKNVRKK